ncbi:hypothetical protein AB4343_16220, partial [Vibrio breoganii]
TFRGDYRKTLKMSKRKYKQQALLVEHKAKMLLGAEVTVRTSQNTFFWSTSEWFSDIKPLSAEQIAPSSTSSADTLISEKDKCISCEGKGFYLYCGGTKKQVCSTCSGTRVRPEASQKYIKNTPKSPQRTLSNNASVNPTTYQNDYSTSYVEGDLGHINTKFWNGR